MQEKSEKQGVVDLELARLIADCRETSKSVRLVNPELTAALINYRAAQLIKTELGCIVEALQGIELNTRNRG